ncbi:hypothetical protein ABZ829_00510 [Streptomyces xanthochromogenes]|uniref:hypothetical protein n=1 Tax=Streptomyces xanthochromogenes TaxID=67384 RepID=UPI0034174E37
MGLFGRRHVDTTPEQRYYAEINQSELDDEQLRRRAQVLGGTVRMRGDVAVVATKRPGVGGGTVSTTQPYERTSNGKWIAVN